MHSCCGILSSSVHIMRNGDAGPGGGRLTWNLPSGKSASLKTGRRPCPARCRPRCTAGCPGWLGPTSTRQNWGEDAWRKAGKHERWRLWKIKQTWGTVPKDKAPFNSMLFCSNDVLGFTDVFKKKKQKTNKTKFCNQALILNFMTVCKYC